MIGLEKGMRNKLKKKVFFGGAEWRRAMLLQRLFSPLKEIQGKDGLHLHWILFYLDVPESAESAKRLKTVE